MRIDYVKILSASTAIMDIAVYALLAISMFTILGSLIGGISMGGGGESLRAGISPSGDVVFSLKMKNIGLLDSNMKLNVKIMSGDNVIGEGEDSIALPPKGEGELGVEFKLTPAQLGELSSGNSKVYFSLESRTLYGLVGMGMKAELGGGM